MPRTYMSRHVHSYAGALLAITFLPITFLSTAVAPGAQAEEAEEVTAQKPVEVGQIAPDFTLPDPDGKDYTASALRGEKNLLLLFSRGAW